MIRAADDAWDSVEPDSVNELGGIFTVNSDLAYFFEPLLDG